MPDVIIPAAALEAGAITLCSRAGYAWTATPDVHDHWRAQARACFLAMLEAWPGMAHYRGGWEPLIHNNRKPHFILSLTEASDGKTLVDTVSNEVWRHDSSGDNCCATDPQEASDE